MSPVCPLWIAFNKSALHSFYLWFRTAVKYSLNQFPSNLAYFFQSSSLIKFDKPVSCFNVKLTPLDLQVSQQCGDIVSLVVSKLLLLFVAPFRTMKRLTPPCCGAKLTPLAWKASGRVQCMWCRCGHGLLLALANTAVRCASKLSQMVRIDEPGSLHPPLSHVVSLPLSHSLKLSLSNGFCHY